MDSFDSLSCFKIQDVSKYIECTEKYPFAEYDDAFFMLPPVQEYLIPYIKRYIEKI